MPIRVLHIIGNLRLGGAQMFVKQIVEHNDDPNIEHVVYPLRSQQIDIPIDGTVIKLPYPNYDPRKFFAIFSLCKQYKIDIIHAHLHKPIVAALLARYFMKIPVLVHEHGSIALQGFQYSLFRFMLRFLKHKAQLFIAVSNAAAHQLTDFSGVDPASIQVVYNAVDLNQFTPNPRLRQSIREELDISPDTVVIGFLGRLSYEKGPDILLDAFRLLLEKKPDCTLIFLGDGTMKQPLMSKSAELGIRKKVRFPGFKANVADYINAFDIAAITSRQDAFPLTPLEIMSMKIPLVSCTVYGLAEVIKSGQNALVPHENTPPEICASLLELIKDTTLRKSLTENASVSVQRFSISNMTTELNGVYHATADTRTR